MQIPARAASSVYLPVSRAARLALEYRTIGGDLVVDCGGDGEAETLLFRGETNGAWRSEVLDLSRWQERLVRLRVRFEPRSEASDQGCLVRRLQVVDDAAPAPARAAPAPGRPPNVVLYVIDTLRADRLGFYGYPRPTSPHLDALARSSIVFDDAVAQSSWTLPSSASLLTGRTPSHHGAIDVDTALSHAVMTVAEQLAARGHQTAAFVSNSLVSRAYGLDRGFAQFHLYPEKAERPTTYVASRAVHRRVRRWLEREGGQRPFFLYVHTTDPHWPYLPAPRHARPFRPAGRTRDDEYAAVRDARAYFFGNEHHGERPTTLPRAHTAVLSDLYDGEVRAADEAFGMLVDDLQRLGLLDRTLVIVTSDHGEEFLDHDGLGHGQSLFHEVLHVPLLVRLPKGLQGGRRVTRPVQHVDVVPTILEVLGLSAGDFDGHPLLDSEHGDAEIVSQLDHLGIQFDSLTTARWKAIRDLGTERARAPVALYDRVADRNERRDDAAAHPVTTEYARQQLRRGAAAATVGAQADPAVLERLRALGYVGE